MKHRKFAVQITTTQDGAWSISQLVQDVPNGEYKRANPNRTAFFDYSDPSASAKLLEAIGKGLAGKLGAKKS